MYVMLEAPLLCMDLSNGNDNWLKMPRSKPGFALPYRTGVNKGPGFWFAVFLSLLSIYVRKCVCYRPCRKWMGHHIPESQLTKGIV